MIIFSVKILGKPYNINNGYGLKNGKKYLKPEVKKWKEDISWSAKQVYSGKILKEYLTMEIHYYFGDNRRRDIDGCHKFIQDALENILYSDDKWIAKTIDDKHPEYNGKEFYTIIKIYKYEKIY